MEPFERAIIGQSDAADAIRRFGRRAADVDAPVLLTGESGTGKGVLARAIHDASARARGPFVSVNCAGVPETLFESEFFGHRRGAFSGADQSHRGLFEQAHRGTLLLDELAELTPGLQAKLLTALEDGRIRPVGGERTRPVDTRVIAATNADLERAVRARRFRTDLYHRLLVLSYRLPPLRDRDGDIELLAREFLDRAAGRYDRPARSFSPDALRTLVDHTWPGNVRELAHAVEAAALACDTGRIRTRHLPRRVTAPAAVASPGPAPGAGERDGHARHDDSTADRSSRRYSFYGSADEERRTIEAALRRTRGNKTRAARALGMARNTLRRKMRRLGIDGA